jgi:hypothetical protein
MPTLETAPATTDTADAGNLLLSAEPVDAPRDRASSAFDWPFDWV